MKTRQLLTVLFIMLLTIDSNIMSAQKMPTIPVDNTNQKPLITKLPQQGKIVKEKYDETLGFKQLELSNGVRVLLKHTDFEQEDILMSAEQRGGSSLYGEKDWANCEMFNAVINACGLGGFSNAELKEALAGKNVRIERWMDTYIDYITGSSDVKDLETLFQLIYLQFTDITKDEKSYRMVLNNREKELKEDLKDKSYESEAVFLDTIMSILYDHNWRYKSFKTENLAEINYDRILEIAQERTANASGYTFVFVGSFNETTIYPLIEQYIASLPANKDVKPYWANVATRPYKDKICHFTHKMESPQTSINIRWINTQIPYSIENDIKAKFLSDILKFKIYREKILEGVWTTHPVGGNEQHYTEGDMTFTEVHSFVDVKPEYADEVIQFFKEEMHKACKHIDEVPFNEYKETQLQYYESKDKEKYNSNAYWLYAIHDRDLDANDDPVQIIKTLTSESISAFARKLVSTGNMIEIVMKPE